MNWKLCAPCKGNDHYSNAADCVRQEFGSKVARNFDFSRERVSPDFQMLVSQNCCEHFVSPTIHL